MYWIRVLLFVDLIIFYIDILKKNINVQNIFFSVFFFVSVCSAIMRNTVLSNCKDVLYHMHQLWKMCIWQPCSGTGFLQLTCAVTQSCTDHHADGLYQAPHSYLASNKRVLNIISLCIHWVCLPRIWQWRLRNQHNHGVPRSKAWVVLSVLIRSS